MPLMELLLDQAQPRKNSESEGMSIEASQIEMQREKKIKRDRMSKTCGKIIKDIRSAQCECQRRNKMVQKKHLKK